MKLDMSTEETPPLSTHHALLGAGQEDVNRTLPPALVLYHMYLKTVHSGLTGEQVLALDGYSFGTFFAEAHQFTCCAGLFPYEKDFVPAFTLSWENGVGFYACGTEDLVRCAIVVWFIMQLNFYYHAFGRVGHARTLRLRVGPCGTCGPSKSGLI